MSEELKPRALPANFTVLHPDILDDTDKLWDTVRSSRRPPSYNSQPARHREIYRDYIKGKTFDAIGDAYGITRGGAWHIVQKSIRSQAKIIMLVYGLEKDEAYRLASLRTK